MHHGSKAEAFLSRAGKSMHLEHLLVFYATELGRKSYRIRRPESPSIPEEKLEELYRLLKARVPLRKSFHTLTADAKSIEAISKELFPAQSQKSIFYEKEFVNRQDLVGYWTDFSDGCRHEYEDGG